MPDKRQEPSKKDTGYQTMATDFPVFRREFCLHVYPEGFKPVGFAKYNGKTPLHQWLQIYSQAIDVARGSNTTKVAYFPLALEPTQLLWLDSLPPNSIDSWDTLRQLFIDSFQGVSLMQKPMIQKL